MNFKAKIALPLHLKEEDGLPRSQDERLMYIKRRVAEGYYDTEKVMKAVADAFLEPPDNRRAGDQAYQKQLRQA